MVLVISHVRKMCRRYKPHSLMTLAQVGYTILYFLMEASFNRGLNPHVYTTYRLLVAGLVMFPFAYFLEKKLRPKLTWALLLEIQILSLLGISLTLNMYFASLRYTSPTFVASMVNTVASMTFVIAIFLRLEHLDAKSLRGMAKIVGTALSLAGVTTMTLYKGPTVRNLWRGLIHIQRGVIHEEWVKGATLTVASCVTWAMRYNMQAMTLKRYPAQLSLTTWMCIVGGTQSAIFTAFIEHKPSAWTIGFDIKFWCIIYSAVVCSGLTLFIQLWCTKEKGPVFVTMFNPLSTVMVAMLAYFIFGEKLHTGSIIGGVTVIVGLYTLLWGKDRDQETREKSEGNSNLAYEEQGESHGVSGTGSCGRGDGAKDFHGV